MNICVYCAASTTIAPGYFRLAEALGTALARRGDTLVYGGASLGLMGAVATAVKNGGGRVVGVIPQALVDREMAFHHADELIIVPGMRERKAQMELRADACIALPGGVGTMDEVFEMLALRQLRLTQHPLVMLDDDGFYAPLRALLEHMASAGFLRTAIDDLLAFATSADQALDHIDGVIAARSASE